jgi:hypothetical protein
VATHAAVDISTLRLEVLARYAHVPWRYPRGSFIWR